VTLQDRAESAPLTWDPVLGGRKGLICFEDHCDFDLGPDPTGERFNLIAKRMLSGQYYPPDAIRCSGRFLTEGRDLRVGDRMVQQAPLFCRLGGPLLSSAVEIYLAERSDDRCALGYVTTDFHFGRGIWSAHLRRSDGELRLVVDGIASPHAWLFWIGLPVARWMQRRAWRRAVEEFRSVAPT